MECMGKLLKMVKPTIYYCNIIVILKKKKLQFISIIHICTIFLFRRNLCFDKYGCRFNFITTTYDVLQQRTIFDIQTY